jgi:hypothetical protein
MKKILFNITLGALLLLATGSPAWGEDKTPVKASPAPLSPGILDVAYVDLTNGFAVRPPAGSLITPPDMADADKALPLLTEWDILKHPESKELVGFLHPLSGQRLTVYLMVTGKKMTVEKMIEARQAYWQQFESRATVLDVGTDTLCDHPAVVSSIAWQGSSDAPAMVLRESLIQLSKKRYFALLHAVASETELSPSFSFVADRVAGNFKCLSNTEIDQRWREAKKNAETLLASLDSAKLKDHLDPLHWYRILYNGEDAGFHLAEEKVQLLPEKQHAFVVGLTGYVDNPKAILPYFEMQGWRVKPGELEPDAAAFTRPVQWVSELSMDGKLGAEQFNMRLMDLTNPDDNLCEKGEWRESKVVVTDCRETVEEEKMRIPFEYPLSTQNEKIYLSLVNAHLVHRLIDKKIGSEYVFVRYLNRNVGYFPLRVNAEIDLKIKGNPATGASGNPDNPNGPEGETLMAYYSVAQLSANDAIVEFWTDEKGLLLRQKSGAVELQQSHYDKIQELWPKQVEAMELIDKRAKPKK